MLVDMCMTCSYRIIPGAGADKPSTSSDSGHRSYSISLPPTPLGATPPLPPSTTSRKQTWSGGGGSSAPGKRRTSSKLPPLPATATPSRVTRSSSGRGKPPIGVPEPPVRVTRSSTAPLPLPRPAGETKNLGPKEKNRTGMYDDDIPYKKVGVVSCTLLLCVQRGCLPFTKPCKIAPHLKLVCL